MQLGAAAGGQSAWCFQEKKALSARLSALYASGLRQVIGGNLGTLALAQRLLPCCRMQLNILNQKAAAFTILWVFAI
ncbi:MAG: hypothetical protein ACLUVV_01470 [Christensenellales bacterium]